jgi:hypothetical protein
MLAPDHRKTLIDSLRPPSGFRLDVAVGTTYSLNLTTLLVVPAAYALFDTGRMNEDEEPAARDLTPIGLLDALRRTDGRITLFCDAAQIAPPVHRRRALLLFIEDAVVPARAPAGGAFHPKLWALRFVGPAQQVVHRLIITTRNLTFDHCWDLVTVLESSPEGIAVPGAGDLLRALPSCAVEVVSAQRRRQITNLAAEVDGTTFTMPDGFTGMRLHTFGTGKALWPFPQTCDRLLVVSPFLSGKTLARLPQAKRGRSLVSRPDELAAVANAAKTFDAFTLQPALVADVATDEKATADDPGRVQEGLHAKLYIADHSEGSTWWIGSANATNAAFARNFEVLLEGDTRTPRLSAKELMKVRQDGDPDARSFRDILVPWLPDGDGIAERPDDVDELDVLRRAIAAIPFTADVTGEHADTYRVMYRSEALPALPADVHLRAWPATTARRDQPVPLDGGRFAAAFEVTLKTMSPFLVLELSRDKLHTRFVVRCTMSGAPADRRQRVMAELLGDMPRILRYLLALLTDEDLAAVSDEVEQDVDGRGDTARLWKTDGDLERLPLVEMMMRTLANNPRRLVEAAELIATVRASGTEFPPALTALWAAVSQVAREDGRE